MDTKKKLVVCSVVSFLAGILVCVAYSFVSDYFFYKRYFDREVVKPLISAPASSNGVIIPNPLK